MNQPNSEGARAVLRMQSANVTQKALLDVLTTKVVRVKQILEKVDTTKPTALRAAREEALRTLALDRHAAQEMRPNVEFDDAEIQAILDRAVDEITEVVMRHL